MPTLVVTTRDGSVRSITAAPDQSAMQVLRDAGVDGILAICGGFCACGTCHVYVTSSHRDSLPAPSADERDLVSTLESRRVESRLACQIALTDALDGIELTVAPEE